MGAMPNEPSMEEILSSIKRIIADEDSATPRPPRRAASAGGSRVIAVDDEGDGHILELTEALRDDSSESQEEDAPAMPASRSTPRNAKPARAESRPRASREAASGTAAAAPGAAAVPPPVLSDLTAQAARDSLQNLSRLLVRDEDGQSNTLEALVREMLRPMLKDWLDANLPGLVETMVKREIDRISGRV